MKATVRFPNSDGLTTPLGVGLATLMREPSTARQQELLHIAYDAGFRHFDVAPSYGLGSAERSLGRFLKTRPKDVTVATKVGIRARGNVSLMRLVQRPARALLRRFPSLRGRATTAVGGALHTAPSFSIDECSRSLEKSLRALGVDCIDLLLLHEATPADLSRDDLLNWLQRQKDRGVVKSIGVATSREAAQTIFGASSGRGEKLDVVQVPSHILRPALSNLPTSTPFVITHSAMGCPLRLAGAKVSDSEFTKQIFRAAGLDAGPTNELAQLFLAWALAENANGIVLIGSSNAGHLRSAAAAVGLLSADRAKGLATAFRDLIGDAAAPESSGIASG